MVSVKSDNWTVVCVKTTNHEMAAPQGKHVRLLMEAIDKGSLSNRASPTGSVFHLSSLPEQSPIPFHPYLRVNQSSNVVTAPASGKTE